MSKYNELVANPKRPIKLKPWYVVLGLSRNLSPQEIEHLRAVDAESEQDGSVVTGIVEAPTAALAAVAFSNKVMVATQVMDDPSYTSYEVTSIRVFKKDIFESGKGNS